jgi:hypothetical protein
MAFTIGDITDPVKRARIMRLVNEYLGTSVRTGENRLVAASGSATPNRVRPSISTDESKLNKTERAFLQWLRLQPSVAWIGIQNVTLKLADDCRYTPDFLWVNLIGDLEFIEVKGFWRDDARVKIKVAARQFPWARFIAVRRVKGEWKFEEIKP